MEHTQGTWRVTGSGTVRYIDVSVGNGMAQEVATCMRTEYGDMEANARRIVACVNACAGLDTEQLEQFGLGAAFGAALFDVTAERNQLLAALKGVTLSQEDIDMGTSAGDEQHAEARAVIKKVSGWE